MIYNILDDNGNNVINTVIASEDFMEANYPGQYTLVGPEPTPPAPPPIITKIVMLSRFTDAEFVSILSSAKTDVEIEAWKIKFDASASIDLSDSRTQAGINLLVSKGILTSERASEVLSLTIADSERA